MGGVGRWLSVCLSLRVRERVRACEYRGQPWVEEGHICIVFELLSMSMLDILTENQFRGLPLTLVQTFTKQLVNALVTLEDANIIHCDLKPENILLRHVGADCLNTSSPSAGPSPKVAELSPSSSQSS